VKPVKKVYEDEMITFAQSPMTVKQKTGLCNLAGEAEQFT
jgi:hypothetical protein